MYAIRSYYVSAPVDCQHGIATGGEIRRRGAVFLDIFSAAGQQENRALRRRLHRPVAETQTQPVLGSQPIRNNFV